MSSESICYFYRRGHCKFEKRCRKSHHIETCVNFPCLDESCTKRHAPICKFFSRFGRCKFGLGCSYLHQHLYSANLESLFNEVEYLKSQNQLLQSKLENLENEIQLHHLKFDNNVMNPNPTSQECFAESESHECFSCDLCKEVFVKESLLQQHVTSFHIQSPHPEPEVVFKCDLCNFSSKSQKGINIHRGSKHKDLTVAATTVPFTNSFPTSSQIPINCIRHKDDGTVDGCQNVILSYFTRYTAICEDCSKSLEHKLRLTPFSHDLCPCCHEISEGPPLSLCQECLQDIETDGWTESGWGSWHMDKKIGKIVCISLDFHPDRIRA